jgi:hypothetical protein
MTPGIVLDSHPPEQRRCISGREAAIANGSVSDVRSLLSHVNNSEQSPYRGQDSRVSRDIGWYVLWTAQTLIWKLMLSYEREWQECGISCDC